SPHIEMKKQTMLSFLPMAHSYEQSVQTAFIMGGGRIGFFSGDLKEIVNDLKTLKPTVLVVVPRLLNRIYNKVMSDVQSSVIKSYLLKHGINNKQKELQRFLVRNNGLWDKIVFKKIRDTFGGNLKLVSSGSAPLSSTILNFFRCALGCFVIEGYGQTECCGPAAAAFPGDYTTGHVGPPVACSQIKLIDVPEMNYFVDQCSTGEVCIKGANVFRGYYKNSEKTLETLDENGWLHTGDIGTWTDYGTLKLIDRKKHIFKLSQGEYIAPEKIENIYCQSPYVAQCFVDGDSLRSCVVAIVIPDIDYLNHWCAQRSINLTVEEACKNNSFRKTVFEDMVNIGKREGLFSFEQAKEIHLHNEPFTLENDLLTPTMKTKRNNCRALFRAKIDEMYSRLETNGQT
ncbi:long-chain-fatty-acid--CoA ligase 1-like isoform X3, partial [Leptotrombidium deliense]